MKFLISKILEVSQSAIPEKPEDTINLDGPREETDKSKKKSDSKGCCS
jgi:hypothetical protein